MCVDGDMAKPTATQLMDAAGISRTYAHYILTGERQPARPLAIHLYRQLNYKLPPIEHLTDEQIDVLETVEPWQRAA